MRIGSGKRQKGLKFQMTLTRCAELVCSFYFSMHYDGFTSFCHS